MALSLFLGKPLVMWGGILTLLLLLGTAAGGAMRVPIKWHRLFAAIAVIVALVHAIFGLAIGFNF